MKAIDSQTLQMAKPRSAIRFPLTETQLDRFAELAEEDRHQEVIAGLPPYWWRHPHGVWLVADSLYDWPDTRARSLKWRLRTATGCHPLDPVVMKIGSCYAHGWVPQ
jgi:hypothetical protein